MMVPTPGLEPESGSEAELIRLMRTLARLARKLLACDQKLVALRILDAFQ